MTQTVVNGYTAAELQAMLKEAREAEKLVQLAAAQRYGQMATELVTALVTETTQEPSKTSAWVGHSAAGLPVTVDGEDYTVSVTITHKARKAEREPIVDQARKDIADLKLTGKEAKDFLAAVLQGFEDSREG
jgi:hypothetical protein